MTDRRSHGPTERCSSHIESGSVGFGVDARAEGACGGRAELSYSVVPVPDMAAELQHDWISCLPSTWSYGVTRDGRLFFVNEEAKSTTWLHPVSGEALITGHRKTPDLPTGWEEGYTFEGARCFIK
uniref:WW domain-containing protein n=1 Tax=Knipowitschia caucasica TaxID=637954 RepID=A0AAV2L0Q3_KNICA